MQPQAPSLPGSPYGYDALRRPATPGSLLVNIRLQFHRPTPLPIGGPSSPPGHAAE